MKLGEVGWGKNFVMARVGWVHHHVHTHARICTQCDMKVGVWRGSSPGRNFAQWNISCYMWEGEYHPSHEKGENAGNIYFAVGCEINTSHAI
jgi:hypothetical protein